MTKLPIEGQQDGSLSPRRGLFSYHSRLMLQYADNETELRTASANDDVQPGDMLVLALFREWPNGPIATTPAAELGCDDLGRSLSCRCELKGSMWRLE